MRTHLTIALVLLVATLAGCASPGEKPATTTPQPGAGIPVREDTKTFTLGAGQNIEWKFRLEEGETFQYAWSATRPVYFDFHGDRDDGTDDFVSHKESTLASDQDAFKVPFTGRHGWYWSNGNAQAISITLTTRGPYEVIGKTGGDAN